MDSTRTRVLLEESSPVIVEELDTESLKASYSITNAMVEEPISDLPRITKLPSGVSIATLSEDEAPSLAEEPEEEEEDAVEALLRRVQKQRSVLGEILEKEIQREEIQREEVQREEVQREGKTICLLAKWQGEGSELALPAATPLRCSSSSFSIKLCIN